MTRGPCDTEQFPGPGFWRLALCWMAVALGSGETSAEDVVFEPVSNLPIVDNFIQVYNPSSDAGSYTIQFADNESDLVLDQVEGDLDAGASALVYLDAVDVDDARLLTVTVSSTFPGFAQHFMWDPQQRVLSNWSSCSAATAPGGMTIPGVRSGALKKIGDWALEIVRRNDKADGFVALPRRWVVERTFAWFGRSRRLAKDFKATVESALAWLLIASIQVFIRRLARL